MSNIRISKLTFRYDDSSNNIFNNLNLNLDSTWKLGLVGRNGRGKTTFLNLLRGKLKGLGMIQTKLTFSYFPVEIKDENNLTLYELQKQSSFEEWELERELNLMGVDPALLWQPFKTLSGGEQTKVLLALSFTDQNSFPLIDEPTNHLDEDSRKQVAVYLSKHDQGYIVVSHDRDFLNKITNHILAIENTEIHLYQGNFASYEETKKRRDEFNEAKNEKLRGEVRRLNAAYQKNLMFAERSESTKNCGRKYKGKINHRAFHPLSYDVTKIAANDMRRAKNIEHRLSKNIDEKKNLMVNIEDVPELSMNFSSDYHDTLLEAKHFGLEFNDGKKLFKDLNLIVKKHGVIALEGKNGTGKTTFLKYILGKKENLKATGDCILTNGLKVSYLPQDFTEYTGTIKEFAEKQKISYEELLNNLKKMGFPRSSFSTPIEEMSMGQQKRVALAKSLVEPANLYLWDEPANYLDVFNQDQLINLLKKNKPAMLLIEHDQYFIDQVAEQKVALKSFN